jgi:hypothetical protein
MPTATVPPPPAPGPLTRTHTFDTRTIVGAGLGLLCLGLIIGFKLAAGMPPLEQPIADQIILRQGPCPECAEKKIRAARAEPEPEAHQAVPGDSSVPE